MALPRRHPPPLPQRNPMAKTNQSEPRAAARAGTQRSPWPLSRIWALALVTFRQAVRAKLWILVPPAIAIFVLADLSSRVYDPIFETIPASVSLSLLVMTVLALVLAIFFATYSLPTELESKIAYTVMTKPVSRTEAVAGKTLGMSLVILAAVGLVGVGSYVHIHIRSSGVRAAAVARLAEVRARTPHAADLTNLQAVADRGPLETYRYVTGPTNMPVMGVDIGQAPSGPPGTQWILGGTGVLMEWPLNNTPLAPWVASSPGRIHLSLRPAQAGATEPKPTAVVVALMPAGMPITREQGKSGPDSPVYQVALEVPPSGEIDVPVSGLDWRPAPGVLNCPPTDDLVLKLAVASDGYALGAGPDSLRIIGPAGQIHTVQAPPTTTASETSGIRRFSLAGRSQTPRQTATFKLADVPESALGEGDATLEAAFNVDAWAPATILPEARITLIRPDGKELVVPFTPDSHHKTLISIDKSFWHGGPLLARLQCQTDDDYLNLTSESIRFRRDGGPFVLNYAKAVLRVWLFGTVLAALSVTLSTRLGWFVSLLASGLIVLVLTVMKSFALVLFSWILPMQTFAPIAKASSFVPDPRDLLPDTSVSMGQAMTAPELLAAAGAALLVVVILSAIGAAMLKGREVAA
jgi:ABC-type transport system involved in multi-copper enzyme maturation permease subunit